jgi:hypothetical protein
MSHRPRGIARRTAPEYELGRERYPDDGQRDYLNRLNQQ